MSLLQQGTVNFASAIQWQTESLAFGPDGFRTTRTGVAQHSVCVTEAELLQADGWEGTVNKEQGPNSRITATIAALDPDNPDTGLLPKWGLDVQFKNVPVEKSQAFRAYITANGGYYGSTFRGISAAVKAAETDDDWTLLDALSSTPKAWAWDIANGITQLEFDAVLRRTNTYASNTGQTADWTDVGKIFTTAQIVALSDPPSGIIGTLPTGYWLKTPAGADDQGDGRVTVNTLWVYGNSDEYPSHRYTYV